MVSRFLTACLVLVALVGVAGAGVAVTQAQTPLPAPTPTPEPTQGTPPPVELSGAVRLNGELAPSGVGMTAQLSDGTLCGEVTTGEGGRYALIPASQCAEGETLTFVLDLLGVRATTESVVPAGPQILNVTFDGLTTEDLVSLGARSVADVAEETAIQTAAELTKSDPLVRDWQLVLLLGLLVAGDLGLLVFMVYRIQGLPDSPDSDKAKSFRRQIEGMVLVGVLLAVVLLGVTDKIEGQGLVSVLSLIGGYAVGRTMAGT